MHPFLRHDLNKHTKISLQHKKPCWSVETDFNITHNYKNKIKPFQNETVRRSVGIV